MHSNSTYTWIEWVAKAIGIVAIALGVTAFVMVITPTSSVSSEEASYCITASSGLSALDNDGGVVVPTDSLTIGSGWLDFSDRLERVCIDMDYAVLPTSGVFDSLALYGPTSLDEPNQVTTDPVIDFLVDSCATNNVKPLAGEKATRYRGCIRMETKAEEATIKAVLAAPTRYYLEAVYTATVDSVDAQYTERARLGTQCKVGIVHARTDYPVFPKCVGTLAPADD